MIRRLQALLFAGGLFLSPLLASGISKVGGGVQSVVSSETSGFSSVIPADFAGTESRDVQKMILQGQPKAGSPFLRDLLILQEASSFQPGWRGLTRDQIARDLRNSGYERIWISNDACVDSWVLSENDQVNMIALWGSDTGLVMAGNNTQRMPGIVRLFLENLQLKPGACGWN